MGQTGSHTAPMMLRARRPLLNPMLKSMKRAGLGLLRGARVFELFASSGWRRGRLLILCYHGVSIADEHEWDGALYVSPSLFERRMALLRARGYSALPLGQALERLREGSLPARSVAITFDDGVWDFYSQAHPVLSKYGLPSTVYLTTYYCEADRPVFNVFCSYLLWKARHRVVEANPSLGIEETANLSGAEARDRVRAGIFQFARREHLSGEAKDDLARELANYLGLPYDEFIRRRILHILRPEEVSKLSAAGVDFQLHTHRHRVPQQRDLFIREIVDNRERIQKMTGKPANHFCYPSGESRSMYFPWLRETDVVSATTCIPGFATAQSDALLLPRLVDVSTLDDAEFEGWLAGVCSFLPRRSHARQLDE